MVLHSLNEINWKSLIPGKKFIPSLAAWENQVFYFPMQYRLSNYIQKEYKDTDGKKIINHTIPLFQTVHANNVDRQTWETQAQGWQGGILKGIKSKNGYLSRMGISAILVSQIFKQVSFKETYHGYGPTIN